MARTLRRQALALLLPLLVLAPDAFAQAPNGLRLVPAAEGNEVRYRVREQLAGVNFPNDAVGVTGDVTGVLVLDPAGRLVPGESRFTVGLASLTSDQSRRDNFIRTRTLEVAEHPTAQLVVTALDGLPSPLPTAGRFTFRLIGDFTVKGVTLLTTWDVSAEAVAGGYRGTATTGFTFADIRLAKPRVASVLSVADQIRLEYDFHLVPEGGGR
jgi:polyisoprenoid-binding protein YceI